MSAPDAVTPRCEACHEPSVAEYPEGTGNYFCGRHLKEWRWRHGLEDELSQVVGDWAKSHKLTTKEFAETLEAVSDDAEKIAKEEAATHVPRPERTDYFIEVNVQDPALALATFHLLKDAAALSGFPDLWTHSLHLKIEVAGDETRLDELQARLDALWLGAQVTSSETLPRRL